MSIEKQARRALWRILFWRLTGELFVLPQHLCAIGQSIFVSLGRWFKALEMAIFSMELDAARRYQLLTGTDLATAAGDPSRYGALNPVTADKIQDAFIAQQLGTDDDA